MDRTNARAGLPRPILYALLVAPIVVAILGNSIIQGIIVTVVSGIVLACVCAVWGTPRIQRLVWRACPTIPRVLGVRPPEVVSPPEPPPIRPSPPPRASPPTRPAPPAGPGQVGIYIKTAPGARLDVRQNTVEGDFEDGSFVGDLGPDTIARIEDNKII